VDRLHVMTSSNRTASLAAIGPFRRIAMHIGLVALCFLPLGACVGIGDAPLFARAETDTQSAAERDQLISLFGGPYKADAALTDVVTEVTERIVKASDDPKARYRLMILNSPSINAFALPSGDIFLTRGLLALANDTAEIGAVIAHEIAHVTAHHAMRRAELEKSVTAIPHEIGADESMMAGDSNRFKLASFSRSQELEADEIGIKTLAKAGYDPYGASRFLLALNRMMTLESDQSGRRKSRASFLASHPSTPQRLSVAIDTAATHLTAKSTEADRNLYLLALNGLTFGDDPDAGLINGRHFYHPRLDFTFDAPDAFLLENSPQAVIGVNGDREQSMRLDTIVGTSAEAALKAGWIEGATLDAIAPLDVSGFTAFTTTAKDREWQYRLAAIEKDGKIFRMIFATLMLTPDLDQKFMDSIRSFRNLRPDELSMLKPLQIAIVRAESGDTIDTLVVRMAGLSHAQDLFRLLNGVDKGGVKEGALYKLVVQK
jgi:predicted Zn-dependent protease